MKKLSLIVLALFFAGCSVVLKDERIDPEKLEQAIFNHEVNINAINSYIKALQEKKLLPLPTQEKK